jgi:hypothetical protein
MLWTSDSPSTSAPTPTSEAETSVIESPIENTLERTDSIETAILAPEDLEGEGPVPPTQVVPDVEANEEKEIVKEEEEVVPKDEIELMEEEGVLEPLPTTSPATLPTESDITNKPTAKTDTDKSTSPSTIDAPAPVVTTSTTAKAEKAEQADEIEKGIENLEEIKDEEQVIQPAVIDLLGSTPDLDSSSSKPDSEVETTSKPDSDATEPEAKPISIGQKPSQDETTPVQSETKESKPNDEIAAATGATGANKKGKDKVDTPSKGTKKEIKKESTKKD